MADRTTGRARAPHWHLRLTVLGVHVTLGARAILWADTECLRTNGESAGHVNKLVANAAASMACITGGWSELGEVAEAIACSAPTFDDAMDALPGRLRSEASKIIGRGRRDPRDYCGQVAILAGYSPRFGCVVAFEFSGAAYFAPVIVSQSTYPAVADVAPPCSPSDILQIALAQARELRVSFPGLGCGRLTMAVVTRDQVTTSAPYDLTNDIGGDGSALPREGAPFGKTLAAPPPLVQPPRIATPRRRAPDPVDARDDASGDAPAKIT